MIIAIHHSKTGFHPRWINYCRENNIPYKLVNCYANDIIIQLKDCNALMWHFSQGNPKDILIAKQLIFSLLQAGIKVFPDFNTSWHFDDKVSQKYLLEAIEAPLVPSYVFYDKTQALKWVEQTNFPKVWKLRGGAGSANVKLIENKKQAQKYIKKAFGSGFKQYNAWSNLQERLRKFRLGKTTLWNILKGFIRLNYAPEFSRTAGRARGYIYFQDFMPDNHFDIRVVVIGDNAFAIKRMVRKKDFRASGSGTILYEKHHFKEDDIKLAFDINEKLKSQCIAMDFVYDKGQTKLIEISYGFSPEGYDNCPGYWDKNLNWIEGRFNPYGWMINNLLTQQKNASQK